jgi:5-methylcytosine-specific restriction endonuclease McrA
MDNFSMDDKKNIVITGTANRYQVKRLCQPRGEPKTRKAAANWTHLYPPIAADKDELSILSSKVDSSERQVVMAELGAKLAGYKRQDIRKRVVNHSLLVDLKTIISLLIESKLECFYCKDRTYILYDQVREKKQWTLDRIDNDYGHNKGNVVIACLECNLRRRRIGTDAFLFTRQLKIDRIS